MQIKRDQMVSLFLLHRKLLCISYVIKNLSGPECTVAVWKHIAEGNPLQASIMQNRILFKLHKKGNMKNLLIFETFQENELTKLYFSGNMYARKSCSICIEERL